jgi:hypothetical protein
MIDVVATVDRQPETRETFPAGFGKVAPRLKDPVRERELRILASA